MTQRRVDVDAAFRGFDRHVLLNGYSGSVIGIVNHKGRRFVRKVARHASENNALRRQNDRQTYLSRHLGEGIAMPKILQNGLVQGRFYFDMEFVSGRDGATFLGNSTFEEIQGFAQQLDVLMRQLANHAPESASAIAPSATSIHEKIEQISRRTNQRFAGLLEPLSEVVNVLPSGLWPRKATGMHGDLTLENIVVDASNRVWLIDTIDGPFEHYWQDFSKLFQDLEGHWHRYRGRALSVSTTAWIRGRLLACASSFDPAYKAVHYPLLALTFARILPYTKSPSDERFVVERVASFTEAARIQVARSLR